MLFHTEGVNNGNLKSVKFCLVYVMKRIIQDYSNVDSIKNDYIVCNTGVTLLTLGGAVTKDGQRSPGRGVKQVNINLLILLYLFVLFLFVCFLQIYLPHCFE